MKQREWVCFAVACTTPATLCDKLGRLNFCLSDWFIAILFSASVIVFAG